MRMIFIVAGLTCRECADKIEAHIQKQPGVNAACLMVTGKFIVDCDDSVAERIEKEVLITAPKAQGDVKVRRVV